MTHLGKTHSCLVNIYSERCVSVELGGIDSEAVLIMSKSVCL